MKKAYIIFLFIFYHTIKNQVLLKVYVQMPKMLMKG